MRPGLRLHAHQGNRWGFRTRERIPYEGLISLLLSLRLPVRQAVRETRTVHVMIRLRAVVTLGSLFSRKIYVGKIKVWSLQSKREWLLPSLPRLPRGEGNHGKLGGLRHVGSSETQPSIIQHKGTFVENRGNPRESGLSFYLVGPRGLNQVAGLVAGLVAGPLSSLSQLADNEESFKTLSETRGTAP